MSVTQDLTRTLASLEPWQMAEIDPAGLVIVRRSWQAHSRDDLARILAQHRPGETLRVTCFPDNWRVEMWRSMPLADFLASGRGPSVDTRPGIS